MKRDKQLMYYLLLQTRDGKQPAELANYSEEEKVYNAALLIHDGYIHGKALPGPDGKYITAVLQDLTSSGHYLLEQMEAQSNQSSATASNEPALSVFISHSSKDIELAEAMTELMRLGIGLTEEDIRCTSVDGYRFEVGAETDAQLKQELKSSKAFIGLNNAFEYSISLRSFRIRGAMGGRSSYRSSAWSRCWRRIPSRPAK